MISSLESVAVSTPLLRYPSAEKLRSQLNQALDACTNAVLAFFSHHSSAGPMHQGAKDVKPDLMEFMAAVTTYLDVYYTVEANWGRTGTQVVHAAPIRIGPMFRECTKGPLLGSLAKIIDDTEAAIAAQELSVPGFGDPLKTPSAKLSLVRLEQLNEHVAWRKVVRTALTLVLFRSFDYKRVWGDVHGDIGMALSQTVGELAPQLTASRDVADFRGLLQNERSFITRSFGRVLTTLLDVYQAVPRVLFWVNGASTGLYQLQELGSSVPFEFSQIPGELFARVKPVSPFPAEMYARPAAACLAQTVMTMWGEKRKALLADNTITHDEFYFKINAATLHHGGQHPPHSLPPGSSVGDWSGHRSGCEFDMDISELPDAQLVIGDHPVVFEVTDGPGGDKETVEVVMAEDASESSPAKEAQQSEEEWDFPEQDTEGRERREEWRAVAEKYSECIFLTFPRYVIFARNAAVMQAKQNLLDRIYELQQSATRDDGELLSLVAALIFEIKERGWLGHSAASARQQRDQHRNHWHVNYRSDWVGPEKGVPSADPRGHERRQSGLAFLRKNNLWRKLLVLPEAGDSPELPPCGTLS